MANTAKIQKNMQINTKQVQQGIGEVKRQKLYLQKLIREGGLLGLPSPRLIALGAWVGLEEVGEEMEEARREGKVRARRAKGEM